MAGYGANGQRFHAFADNWPSIPLHRPTWSVDSLVAVSPRSLPDQELEMHTPAMIVSTLLASSLLAPITRAPAQAPSVVTVTATDFKFEAPATVAGGTVTFRLQNSGKEVHHLWLVQLLNGKTLADFQKAMDTWTGGPMPAWAVDVGGPN